MNLIQDVKNNNWWFEFDYGPVGYWSGSLMKKTWKQARVSYSGEGKCGTLNPVGPTAALKWGAVIFQKKALERQRILMDAFISVQRRIEWWSLSIFLLGLPDQVAMTYRIHRDTGTRRVLVYIMGGQWS